MRLIVLKKRAVIYLICCIVYLALYFFVDLQPGNRTTKTLYIMGAESLYELLAEELLEATNADEYTLEAYVRPSQYPAINTRKLDIAYYDDPSKIIMPKKLFITPEDTLLNYFSLLRDASNLGNNQIGGCGTVGMGRLPYPIAYKFFTEKYKDKISYEEYLYSFRGIGHTTLIKYSEVPKEATKPESTRFFVEFETIEGSNKNLTYFAYYYGFVTIVPEGDVFKIDSLEFGGEDFLCAPYHGWTHNAEASVAIRYGDWCSLVKEIHPVEIEGFVKNIYFSGKDGNEYKVMFINLTNNVDIEIATYKKDSKGQWAIVHIDPEKCLEEKYTSHN